GMQKMHRNGHFFWPLSDGENMVEYPIEPIMVANDPAAVRGALLCGEGLMLASDIMVKSYAEQGYIRRVLAGWTGPEYDLNALFPRGQVTSPKIRAFVDFLVERLSFDSDYMQVLCPDARARCKAARQAADSASTVNAELARASRAGAEEQVRDDEDVELACQADARFAVPGDGRSRVPDRGGVRVRARGPSRAGRRRPAGRTGRGRCRLRQPGAARRRRPLHAP